LSNQQIGRWRAKGEQGKGTKQNNLQKKNIIQAKEWQSMDLMVKGQREKKGSGQGKSTCPFRVQSTAQGQRRGGG